jgi:hypothetical protein
MVRLGKVTGLRVMPHCKGLPNLNRSNTEKTSPSGRYANCIAWAAGRKYGLWWPRNLDAHWPSYAPNEETVAAFEAVFNGLGYSNCKDGSLEEGYEKIAIYARGSKPTHAARQLADGRWTSKLGDCPDITHEDLRTLEDGYYGQVARIMKRRRQPTKTVGAS